MTPWQAAHRLRHTWILSLMTISWTAFLLGLREVVR